jgi:D-alanyl-D-alanine carboxypeptidase
MARCKELRTMKKIALALILLGAAAASMAQAPARSRDIPTIQREVQGKLDEWHKTGKFPGATLGVAMPDGKSYGFAVGHSDREAMVAMKPSDRMLGGSTGKTFAAATALQLVAEGKIGLNDKVSKYLGKETWFSRLPNAADVTVRQLMNHTSGLVRYEFKEQFTKDLTANPDRIWRPEQLLAYLLDEKAPFAAGAGWEYSDTNYIVLGMIIERVTGKRFYDEATRRFVKPYKLVNTFPQNSRSLAGLVQGYAGENNPFGGTDRMITNGKFAINPQFEWTGGGWVTNSEDLARWAKLMYEGNAFDVKMVGPMLDGVPAKLGKGVKYGLGVIIRPTPAGITYGHSGFFPGYLTDFMYFPDRKIAIAVQVNSSAPQIFGGKPPARLLAELAEIIAPATLASGR